VAEIHITSAIAFVKPGTGTAIAEDIRSAGLAEVPRIDPRGRLVLLLERPSTAAILDSLDAIRALPGVLAVHLVYQHAEQASALAEELP
jgi:periplasmic nitrate reductase NapD